MAKIVMLLLGLFFSLAIAQVELEFAPLKGEKVTPAVLREARNVLQQRLETFFVPGQKFQVIPRARTILVRLESIENIESVIALCTAMGKLEFVDSETYLELTDSVAEESLVVFTDEDIQKTSASLSEFGGAVVELELTPEGTDKLARYSRDNIGRFLVIVKDGEILSSPTVQTEIPDGQVWIQSNFTLEEAQRLAAELAGRLPVPLVLIKQN